MKAQSKEFIFQGSIIKEFIIIPFNISFLKGQKFCLNYASVVRKRNGELGFKHSVL